MEERGLLLLLLTLFSVSVSGQYGSYGDRFAVDGDNAVDTDAGCPDFGPMDSFSAEGLHRGKVRSQMVTVVASLGPSDALRVCFSQPRSEFGIKSF